MNERIFIVEWRTFNNEYPVRELKTAESIEQLFNHYIDTPSIVYFAFEDVTDLPIEEVERRMVPYGKYSM